MENLVARPLLTADEMRACETQAIREWGIFSLVLQEHAALGALALIPVNEPIQVLVGPGNNGGDALALARLARLQGRDVEVYAPAHTQSTPIWKGDAAVQARLWEGLGGSYKQTNSPEKVVATWCGWLVDGIFGLGTKLPVCENVLPWIEAINNNASRFKTIALDLPTGLDPSSGDLTGPAIRADLTACFGHMKRCHGLLPARELCGEIYIVQIPLNREPDCRLRLLSRPQLTEPLWNSHKYDNGHVAIRAGTKGMSGAGVLAAIGALRSGAGLVTVMPDADVVDNVAAQIPEAIVKPWEGVLPDKIDVLLVGPGGVEEIPEWNGPLVLDASALKEGEGSMWMTRPNTIITPHEGEFARLFGKTIGSSTQERLEALESIPKNSKGVLVLKGAQTLIKDGLSTQNYVNPTGHAGLATGGTGDFMAGMLAAMYAKNPNDAAKAATQAVWLHGAAADRLGRGPALVRELGDSLAMLLREQCGV